MSTLGAKTDLQIQRDVESELAWDPTVTATDIRVKVAHGFVTLFGSIPHYSQKDHAERAALRVDGVLGVADEVVVGLPTPFERSDEDIARAAQEALAWNYQVPAGISVSVDRAWVTLRGETEWEFERKAAEHVAGSLVGVRGVTNNITLHPRIEPSDMLRRIQMALQRSAQTDLHAIGVTVDGSRVTLSGRLHSRSDMELARCAAWSCPGVTVVENNLQLSE